MDAASGSGRLFARGLTTSAGREAGLEGVEHVPVLGRCE